MARRSSSSRSRPISLARKTSWETGPQLNHTVFTAVGPTVWTSGRQAVVEALTFVRIRGLITFNITGTGITNGMSGAWGIGIASENAFGVGLTALMNPFDDSGWDGWMAHGFWSVDGDSGAAGASLQVEIDSKAMRKIDETDVLYGSVDVAVETGTCIVSCTADTRVLFKLP